MTEKMLRNRVKKLRDLEAQKKELENQIEEIKDELKMDMEAKNVDRQQAGEFLIRWTMVIADRFDTKTFKQEHVKLYEKYLKQVENRRFSIA